MQKTYLKADVNTKMSQIRKDLNDRGMPVPHQRMLRTIALSALQKEGLIEIAENRREAVSREMEQRLREAAIARCGAPEDWNRPFHDFYEVYLTNLKVS